MSPAGKARICLATATTERFVPGTLVLIGSFLRRHPGFDGDVVVVHDGLPERLREVLSGTFDGLRFMPVSPELVERVERVRAALPERGFTPARFFALDAFRLRGYRKVLFCDSDLLFRAAVDSLFDSPHALLCCGDKAFLEGRRRDAATFAPLRPGGPAGAGGVLERTFNSGFLLIDDALIAGGRCHGDLLATISPAAWRDVPHPWADQLLLNRYFAGRQTLIGSTYNFLLASARAIRAREGVDIESARVLHYVKGVKPWSPDAMLRWAWDPGSAPAAAAFRFWYDAWLDVLSYAHVRAGVSGRAGWTFA